MSGHQPELCHPGVWLKNFVLHRLARKYDGASLHLIVDHDAVKSTSLLAPSLSSGRPRAVPVPIDRVAPGLPYEEWTAADEELFAALPERTRCESASLLLPFWDEVCRHASRTRNVPERFSAARRTFERAWGCHNLELPVSRLCGTEAFARFTAQLLSELPRFHEVFNGAVRAY